MLGRMFGHEFHALLIFQKFLISDDVAALFGISSPGEGSPDKDFENYLRKQNKPTHTLHSQNTHTQPAPFGLASILSGTSHETCRSVTT